MQKFGCERGIKIFFLMENTVDLAPLAFAAMSLSCPIVGLSPTSSQDECKYIMNLTKPEFAICELKNYPMLKKCFADLNINGKIFTIDGQADDSISTELLFANVDNESDFK